MTQSKLIAPLIIGALVIGGGSFYGGMRYSQAQAPASRTGGQNRTGGARGAFVAGQGQGGGFQGRNAGGFSNGEVISKDSNSLTLKLSDGGSKIVFFSSSTMVGKMATSSVDDINQGTNVTVMGTPNQDGSIAASMIQIRPQGQGFGRPMPDRMP